MKKQWLTLSLAAALLVNTAMAAPSVTSQGYTAYLGSNNELYLQDVMGQTRVLRYPVGDVLSITDTVVYCRAQDGKLLSIALDGSQSLIVADQPSEAQLTAVTATTSYTLVDGTLRDGAGNVIDTNVLAFCDVTGEVSKTAPGEVLYLQQNTASTIYLKTKTEDAQQARTLSLLTATTPILSMAANAEAITMVGADHSVVVYDRASGMVMTYPATSEKTEMAVVVGGEVICYARNENFGWDVETGTTLPSLALLSDNNSATPTPTMVPTATPTPTQKPTPTPKPTATATPESQYSRINYGSSGTAVRKLQNRLSKLGYPVGKVDGVWGEDTQLAVSLFQFAIGYTEHKYASPSMQEKLYSKKAPTYDAYTPLKEGKKGMPVRLMQQRLFDLGYFVSNDVEKEVDGVYGKRTTEAIKLFQTTCGYLPEQVTGEADADTLLLLYAEDAPVYPGAIQPPPAAPDVPTDVPTDTPTDTPTDVPTDTPTDVPTDVPTDTPNDVPTDVPTDTPTDTPTDAPTDTPTDVPTDVPTDTPTDAPTGEPTDEPTENPETPAEPSSEPTDEPTESPETPAEPSDAPTNEPSDTPTDAPEASDDDAVLLVPPEA